MKGFFINLLRLRLVLFFALVSDITLAPAQEIVVKNQDIGWQEFFQTLSKEWQIKGKYGVPLAKFYIANIEEVDGQKTCLRMEAEGASASLIIKLPHVDFTKYNILRWAWRVIKLPDKADGRIQTKDDQAIGIYISSGNFLTQEAIAYRWETETPVGTIGNTTYANGIVKIKWFALRNKNDDCKYGFLVEERDAAKDFKEAFGYVPKNIGISISCNSQYTKSIAIAEMAWIALLARSSTNIFEK